jgi:hypothetical protein
LEATEFLYTSAEVGVAISGIAALMVALGQGRRGAIDALTIIYVGSIVERGLASAFFALLPILISGFELSSRVLWLLSSGLLAGYILSLAYRSYWNRKRDGTLRASLDGITFGLLMIIGLLMAGLQIAHASGLLLEQNIWWYTLGVAWLLVTMGYIFMIFLRSILEASEVSSDNG